MRPFAPAAPAKGLGESRPIGVSVTPRPLRSPVPLVGRGRFLAQVALAAVLGLGALASSALPARAQDYWGDQRDWENMYAGQPKSLSLSATAGEYWSSPWNDLVLLGSISTQNAIEQVLLRQVQVSPARLYGGSITYRRGRAGARLQVGYSKSCLEIAGSCDPGAQGSPTQLPLPRRIDVKTWTADVEGEVGLVPGNGSRWARPFLLVGGGAVAYRPSGRAADLLPQFLEFPGGTASTSGTNVFVQFPGAGQIVADVQGAGLQTVFAAVLGVGTDLRVPIGNGGFGVRIQAADHIAGSPMHVRILQGGNTTPATFDFGAIHNYELSVGGVIDFDLGKVKAKSSF